MKKKNPKIEVVQSEDKPVPTKVMAQAIVDMAQAMKTLRSSPLRENTIILLVSEKARVGRREVKQVLEALNSLEEDWLK